MARTETISVYLLKESVKRPEQALREGVDDLRQHDVDADGTTGTLFVRAAKMNEPGWVQLLRPVTNPPVEDRSGLPGGLMVLRTEDRFFALAFGHGRTLLDPAAYVRDFGLRAALNGVDATQLRGVEARTFNEHALHTQRQISRLSTIEGLEMDVERDLLTSLSGQIVNGRSDLGKRMDGRDAARLTCELEPGDIASKCAQLYELSQRTDYKRRFPWVDTIERINDPTEIERLNEVAYATLGQRVSKRFDVFPPELTDDEVVLYELHPGRRQRVEPDHDLLGHVIGAPMSPAQAAAAIATYRLDGIDGAGNVVDSWPLWECLHHEFDETTGHYVLDRGRWYRVEAGFAAAVAKFASGLGPSGLAWPNAQHGESEGDYNIRAARETKRALLDKANIILHGRTAIEPCDLFSDDRWFVHVKHRKGGSAPLSHLFNQALVSAECFVAEPDFRAELSTKLETARTGFGGLVSRDAPTVSDFGVVLGLLVKPASAKSPAQDLPFFSKVALRLAARHLIAMGLRVAVDGIAIDMTLSGVPAPRGRRVRPRKSTHGLPIRAGSAARSRTKPQP